MVADPQLLLAAITDLRGPLPAGLFSAGIHMPEYPDLLAAADRPAWVDSSQRQDRLSQAVASQDGLFLGFLDQLLTLDPSKRVF
jgi:hypothetical protein